MRRRVKTRQSEKHSAWELLIKQFESSGLSQEEFCRERLIPLTKFKYRWRRQMEIKNVRRLDTQYLRGALEQFEEVSIFKGNSSHAPVDNSRCMSIQFPNDIRLNLSVTSPEFSLLLEELNVYYTFIVIVRF